MGNVRLSGSLTGTALVTVLALAIGANPAWSQSSESAAAAAPTAANASANAEQIPPSTQTIAPAAGEIASTTGDTTPAPAKPSSAEGTIAERLRDQLVAGKFDRILGGRKERTAIETFYSSREFAPLWIANGTIGDRGKAAAAYIAAVDAEGLDPSDYPLPQIKPGADADALADAEIRFTDAVLTYARHAQAGRVHFSRIAADIAYDLARLDPSEALTKLAKADDVKAALDSYNPPHLYYKALKAKLAEVRKGSDVEKPVIPSGPVLKYSKDKKRKEVLMEDPRVPTLRQRFGIKSPEGDTTYDKKLADTIAKFQKEHGLQASGQLNKATLDVINGPKRERTADIIVANMERWRWISRDLGKTYVMVNIPDYTLRVMRDGKLVWKTKIVVGKPNLPTPILSADMKFITVNPTWNVPPSIIQNEYLPALAQDPQAMERIGLKVEQNPDGTVRIWQPPGDRNALGRIRFNFPNKFLVYQHDTPDKHLFAHERRAYSHGCMRVQDPLKYGEVLLSLALPNERYTAERLQKMFGASEININFPTALPVHLTYQTAFVDDDNKLQIRDDIYGRDQRVLAVLKGSDRKVADTAIERPKANFATPVRMPPGTFASSGGSSFGGGSFFDRLFGSEPPRPSARVGSADRWRATR